MSESEAQISNETIAAFLGEHRLPATFETTARDYYEPLARRLPAMHGERRTLLLGINGAQGTGKSTLADFLEVAAAELFGWRTAVLSIDDFYLTRAERQTLAEGVHPLFATRGVPGTHDAEMLSATLDELANLGDGDSARLPRFDKSIDDRARDDHWPEVTGPLDLIVLEGWCVGSSAEPPEALIEPVNVLEGDEDPEGIWRGCANDRLSFEYEPIFSRLDALVFLAAPSFNAILQWRVEQEHKLAKNAVEDTHIMSDDEVARFIGFYERITRHNLEIIPSLADVVFALDESHAVIDARYRRPA